METVPSQKFVVLIRCSTKTQHASGHGLNAQRRDIDLYLQQQEKHQVVAEFVEVESGAAASRPVLDQAITTCKKHTASLLVSKVDRASRDLETLARIVKTVPIESHCRRQIHFDTSEHWHSRSVSSSAPELMLLLLLRKRGGSTGQSQHRSDEPRSKKCCSNLWDKHAPLVTALRSEGKTLRQIARSCTRWHQDCTRCRIQSSASTSDPEAWSCIKMNTPGEACRF